MPREGVPCAELAASRWTSHVEEPADKVDYVAEKTGKRPCPNSRGRVVSREIREGFLAAICDLAYLRDTTVEIEVEPSLTFGICTGEATSLLSIHKSRDFEIKPLCPLLVAIGRHASCRGHHMAGSRHISVGFCATKKYLENLLEEHDCGSFVALLNLLRGDVSLHHMPQSERLLGAATSMLQNPYEGALLLLHLESCALGLLTELARIVSGTSDQAAGLGLGRREYERAQEVRRILEENIASPPSLAELSRLVGVNATTMSQQFRAVFGSTVFSYVRGRRLELAQAMLRSQSIPVSQVGYRVGFSNPGAFATAYRRHFGRPPSAEPRKIH